MIDGDANGGVAASAHVDERDVRGRLWIGGCARIVDVTGLCILQAGADAVSKQQIHLGLWTDVGWSLTYEQRSKWMIFGKAVLRASTMVGAEIEPVMNAMPTGSIFFGGRPSADRPARNSGDRRVPFSCS